MERDFWDYRVEDAEQAAAAKTVYLDLCEGRPQWNVEHFFDRSLNMICLRASFNHGRACAETIVPVPGSRKGFSPEEICSWSSIDPDSKIVLAVAAEDAVLYYNISSGFRPPPLPAEIELDKFCREARRRTRVMAAKNHGNDPECQLEL